MNRYQVMQEDNGNWLVLKRASTTTWELDSTHSSEKRARDRAHQLSDMIFTQGDKVVWLIPGTVVGVDYTTTGEHQPYSVRVQVDNRVETFTEIGLKRLGDNHPSLFHADRLVINPLRLVQGRGEL